MLVCWIVPLKAFITGFKGDNWDLPSTRFFAASIPSHCHSKVSLYSFLWRCRPDLDFLGQSNYIHCWIFGLTSLKFIRMTEFLRHKILDERADEQQEI